MQNTTHDHRDDAQAKGREFLHRNLCSYYGLKRIVEVNGFRVEELKSYGGLLKPLELLLPFYNRVLVVRATK